MPCEVSTMKKPLFLIFISFLIMSCSEEGAHSLIQKANAGCGVTSLDKDNNGFVFRCDADANSDEFITDFSALALSESQMCNIVYDQKGQPKQFKCHEMPTTFDKYFAQGISLNGRWQCKGLDNYNNQTHVSLLTLHSDGRYNIAITGKSNSESIWFAGNSEIEGMVTQNNTHKLRLAPTQWTGDIIDKTQLTLKDAPTSMLASPLVLSITSLTEQALKADINSDNIQHDFAQKLDCSLVESTNVLNDIITDKHKDFLSKEGQKLINKSIETFENTLLEAFDAIKPIIEDIK